jgi:hypothetical protein
LLNITRYVGQAVGLRIQATSQAAAGTVLNLDNFVRSGGQSWIALAGRA